MICETHVVNDREAKKRGVINIHGPILIDEVSKNPVLPHVFFVSDEDAAEDLEKQDNMP